MLDERGFDAGKAEAWSEWTEGLNETIRTELTAARKAGRIEVLRDVQAEAMAAGNLLDTQFPAAFWAVIDRLAEE